ALLTSSSPSPSPRTIPRPVDVATAPGVASARAPCAPFATSDRRPLHCCAGRVASDRPSVLGLRREERLRTRRARQAAGRDRDSSLGRTRARQGEARGGGQAMMRASLFATFSLLAWAATASAECAWVFWLEAGDARTHESSSRPVSGWGTREACEQALTQK